MHCYVRFTMGLLHVFKNITYGIGQIQWFILSLKIMWLDGIQYKIGDLPIELCWRNFM